MGDRYDADDLIRLASALLRGAGLDPDKADCCAAILVEADLLGHDTHGLALLPFWLEEARAGRLVGTGTHEVVAQTAVAALWDGGGRPGPWLVTRAAEWASGQADEHGLAAVAIRHSGHIGAAASYLAPIAERGQILLLATSDPAMASIAPAPGALRVFSPNVIAAGWPTTGTPVLADISLSATTNAMVRRRRAEGRPFENAVMRDADGRPSHEPETFFSDPPGSIRPLGGEAEHKGVALLALVEALTSGLAGHGRADAPVEPWRASVFVRCSIPPGSAGGRPSPARRGGPRTPCAGPAAAARSRRGCRATARTRVAPSSGRSGCSFTPRYCPSSSRSRAVVACRCPSRCPAAPIESPHVPRGVASP